MKKKVNVFLQLPATFMNEFEVDIDQYNLICSGDEEAIGLLLDKFDFSECEADIEYKVREAMWGEICDDETGDTIADNII